MKPTLSHSLLFLLPLALSALAFQGGTPAKDTPPAPPQGKTGGPSARNQVVAGSNRLGFQLLGKLLEAEAGRNVFLSPASIATALTLTWTGAAGETAAAMAGTLGLEGVARDEVITATRGLLDGLAGRKGIELRAANAIWCRSGLVLRQEFIEDAKRSFSARVESADFADPKTLAAINAWVSKETGGRIQGALDRVPADTLLYLLSAIWFKAQWLDKFEAKRTVKETVFHLADGGERRVPMMLRRGELSVFEDETLVAVKLPYADRKTSMVIMLPVARTAAALAELVTRTGATDFPAWLRKFEKREGLIGLPRFRVEYGADLKPALVALGMGSAFDASADFSRIREQRDLVVSRVLHKSFVEVNEEGTEAAAVTIFELKAGAEPGRQFELRADRPFLFAVCDEERGAVLFAGVVQDPGA